MSANKIKFQKTKLQESRFDNEYSSDSFESLEKIIKKQNEFLNSVLNSLEHPFLIVDAKDYTIRRHNQKVSIEDLPQGTTCHKLMRGWNNPCDGRDHICPIKQVKETNKPAVIEHIRLDEDGNQIICEVRAFPIFNEAGKVVEIIEYLHDITERRQVEKAFIKSNNDYRQLFNSMINGFALHEIVFDKAGKPIDYKFLEMNPAFERLTGLKADNLIGKNAYEVIPGLESSWLDKYSKVALTGEPIHFENFSAALDQYFQVTAYRPARGQFACIFSNITDHKLTERALRESEQKFSTAFAAGPDSILITRLKDGKIIEANDQYLKTFGYAMSEVIGKTSKELNNWANPEDSGKFIATLKNQGQVDNMEINVRLRDDRELLFQMSARPIRVGGEYCVISIARDITERKIMAKKLQTAHEEFITEQVKLTKKNTTVIKAEYELRTAHEKLVIEQVALRGKNIALKEIMNQTGDEKKQLARIIQSNVDRALKPILRKLKEKSGSLQKEYITLLENSLSELTSPFIFQLEKQFTKLSPRETEICKMIKDGLSSKDIASVFDISDQTVIKHRKRIRKKLGIGGQKVNLVSHLKSIPNNTPS